MNVLSREDLASHKCCSIFIHIDSSSSVTRVLVLWSVQACVKYRPPAGTIGFPAWCVACVPHRSVPSSVPPSQKRAVQVLHWSLNDISNPVGNMGWAIGRYSCRITPSGSSHPDILTRVSELCSGLLFPSSRLLSTVFTPLGHPSQAPLQEYIIVKKHTAQPNDNFP